MNVSLWRQRFREHMEERNWSRRTIEAYTAELVSFIGFLEARGIVTPNAITRDAVEAYRAWLCEQKMTMRTVAVHLNAAKAFLRFLAHEQFILMDPGLQVDLPRTPRTLPRPLISPSQVAQLMEAPDVTTTIGLRDRAALEVFYATAVRNSELCGLYCGDIDLNQQRLTVRCAKGGSSRVLPLGEEAVLWLDLYLQRARPQLVPHPHEPRLFLSWRGRPMDREMVAHIVVRAAELAGLEVHVTPHVLRHCCATHMLANGANLRHVQELLGHASAETTARYTQVVIADLAEVHQRCHPRERRIS